jgi:hypothetical protein
MLYKEQCIATKLLFAFSPEDSFERDLVNQLSVHCRSAHYNKIDDISWGKQLQYALDIKNENNLKKRADTIVS